MCEVFSILESDKRSCEVFRESDGESVFPSIEIFDEKIYFNVKIHEHLARLSDLVPLARAVSSKIVEVTLKKLKEGGHSVPCRKGCSACCSYLIPLSVPEVFRLWDEIEGLPEDNRREILKSIIKSAKCILKEKRSGLICGDISQTDAIITANRISRWYAGIELVCPFLSGDECSWYGMRPLACREHIVKDSAQLCIGHWSDTQKVVRMPVSALEAIGELAGELEQTDVEAIMLPFAPAWARDNFDRSHRTWPAREMIERYFEILNRLAFENSDLSVAVGQAVGLNKPGIVS